MTKCFCQTFGHIRFKWEFNTLLPLSYNIQWHNIQNQRKWRQPDGHTERRREMEKNGKREAKNQSGSYIYFIVKWPEDYPSIQNRDQSFCVHHKRMRTIHTHTHTQKEKEWTKNTTELQQRTTAEHTNPTNFARNYSWAKRNVNCSPGTLSIGIFVPSHFGPLARNFGFGFGYSLHCNLLSRTYLPLTFGWYCCCCCCGHNEIDRYVAIAATDVVVVVVFAATTFSQRHTTLRIRRYLHKSRICSHQKHLTTIILFNSTVNL